VSQHHFLIRYDSETKLWEWDIDTEMSVLPQSVYLPESNTWVKPTHSKRVEELDNNLCDRVGFGLNYLNTKQQKKEANLNGS